MKAITNKKIEITLVLNEEEARWLKGYIQNWMYDQKEPTKSIEIRMNLFKTLEEVDLI